MSSLIRTQKVEELNSALRLPLCVLNASGRIRARVLCNLAMDLASCDGTANSGKKNASSLETKKTCH